MHDSTSQATWEVGPTDSEPDDKECNGEKGDFSRDIEGLRNAHQIRSDNATGERDDEARKRHDHGAVPLVRLGPILGIFGIIDLEGDKLPVFHSAIDLRSHRLDDLSSLRFRDELLQVCIGGHLTVRQINGVQLVRLRSDRECPAEDSAGTGGSSSLHDLRPG